MARYLVAQESQIVDLIEAKSMKDAVESLNPNGEGAFEVYTLQGPSRVVRFETVSEVRLTIEDAADEEE